jgi:hypothetical protein
MKLTRPKRIALELLGPPLLGTIFLLGISQAIAVWYAVQHRLPPPGWGSISIQTMGGVLIGAYLYAGIPSIIYTWIMEWRFNRGLNPVSWGTVLWSSFLGFLSGAGIVVAFDGYGWHGPVAFFGGTGCTVGFSLGLLIKVGSTEKKAVGEISI